MSLLKMRIIDLLDRHRRVTAVADALGMKQPTVSFHMKNMEKEWGVKLFENRSGRIYLTAAGRTLLSYARQITKLYGEAEAAIGEIRETGRSLFRIGCTDCAMTTMARSGWFAGMANLTGETRIEVIKEDEDRLFRMLETNRLDMAICGRASPDPDAQSSEILASPLMLVMPSGASAPLPGEDLEAETKRLAIVEHAERSVASAVDSWRSEWRAPPALAVIDSVELIVQAVHGGAGIALLPECVLPDPVRRVTSAKLPGHPSSWLLYASWKPNDWNAKIVIGIVESLRGRGRSVNGSSDPGSKGESERGN